MYDKKVKIFNAPNDIIEAEVFINNTMNELFDQGYETIDIKPLDRYNAFMFLILNIGDEESEEMDFVMDIDFDQSSHLGYDRIKKEFRHFDGNF